MTTLSIGTIAPNDNIYKYIEDFNKYENEREKATQYRPSIYTSSSDFNPTRIDEKPIVIESSNSVAKKSLASIETMMPQKPITFKQMKNFKLDFENDLRSMGIDYIIDEEVEKPDELDPSYATFQADNKFVYSALIKTTKGHEAREWLLPDEVEDDGREGWFRLLKQYDLRDADDNNLGSAMNRLANLRLSKTYIGAASAYVTTFQHVYQNLLLKEPLFMKILLVHRF